MKRSILMSLLVIGAVATLVTMASWANFSDTETSNGNIVSTGSLNLKVGTTTNGIAYCNYVDPWVGPLINVSNAKPGDTDEVTICVKNDGSIAGTLDADVDNVTDTEIGCNEPEQAAENSTNCTDPVGELSEHLVVDIWVDGDCDNLNSDPLLDGNPEPTTGDNWFFSNDLDALNTYDFPAAGMPATAEWCYGVAWTVDSNAGNEIQTDKVTADVTFTLTQ